MSKRRLGALLVGLLLVLGGLGGPAAATEAEEGGVGGAPEEVRPPTIEELRQQSGETAQEFFPEPVEQPAWFRFLLWPLVGAGVLISLFVFLRYLQWQPHFSREARERAGARRR